VKRRRRRFWADSAGAIAVETALVSGILVVLIAQALDLREASASFGRERSREIPQNDGVLPRSRAIGADHSGRVRGRMDLAVASQHGDGNFENDAVDIEAG